MAKKTKINEIIIKHAGVYLLRFEPYAIDLVAMTIDTPRRGRPWPIPTGAEVWGLTAGLADSEAFLIGTVTRRTRIASERCRIRFEAAGELAGDEDPLGDEAEETATAEEILDFLADECEKPLPRQIRLAFIDANYYSDAQIEALLAQGDKVVLKAVKISRDDLVTVKEVFGSGVEAGDDEDG